MADQTDSPKFADRKHPDDQKHEITVARRTALTGGAFLLLTTAISGCSAVLVGRLGARATLDAAKITAKSGSDQPSGFIQNIQNVYYGIRDVGRLGDPKVSVAEVFPATATVSKSPGDSTPNEILSSGRVSAAVSEAQLEEAVAVDPKVLDSCVGFSPLHLDRLFVESVGNGFNLSFRISNPTKQDISLYLNGPRSLNDSEQHDYGAGGSNLPSVGYGTYDDMPRAFDGGVQVDAGDSGSINLMFRGVQSKAETISAQANLDEVIKVDGDKPGVKKTTITCSAVPVIKVLNSR